MRRTYVDRNQAIQIAALRRARLRIIPIFHTTDNTLGTTFSGELSCCVESKSLRR